MFCLPGMYLDVGSTLCLWHNVLPSWHVPRCGVYLVSLDKDLTSINTENLKRSSPFADICHCCGVVWHQHYGLTEIPLLECHVGLQNCSHSTLGNTFSSQSKMHLERVREMGMVVGGALLPAGSHPAAIT